MKDSPASSYCSKSPNRLVWVLILFLGPFYQSIASSAEPAVTIVREDEPDRRPVMHLLDFGPGRGFTFEFEGPPGTYEIQRTSDLAHWSRAGLVIIEDNPVIFTDTSASRIGNRLYRALLLE